MPTDLLKPDEYRVVRLARPAEPLTAESPARLAQARRVHGVQHAGSHEEAARSCAEMLDTMEGVWQGRVGRQQTLDVTDHVGRTLRFVVCCVRIVPEYEAKEVAAASTASPAIDPSGPAPSLFQPGPGRARFA